MRERRKERKRYCGREFENSEKKRIKSEGKLMKQNTSRKKKEKDRYWGEGWRKEEQKT